MKVKGLYLGSKLVEGKKGMLEFYDVYDEDSGLVKILAKEGDFQKEGFKTGDIVEVVARTDNAVFADLDTLKKVQGGQAK